MRMSRRARRSGINYVRNDRDRSLTFFKRRLGLFKTANDLSTLTGARIVVVVESENEKMAAFGTPSAGPIIDCFLLGNVPVDPYTDEAQKSRIIDLQNHLFKLEKDMTMENKRTRESMVRTKEIQESSRLAKLVYGKVEDLGVGDLNKLLHGLSRINQEIQDRQPPQLQHAYQPEIGGLGDPALSLSSSSQSQIRLPPIRLPWTPLQPSLQAPRPSWPLPQSSMSQSSLLNPTMIPSPQAPPMPRQQQSLIPQYTLMVPPQAHMMPLPDEARQHNYLSQGVGVNGNTLGDFSQSSLLSSLPPPPPPSSTQRIPLSNEFSHLSSPLQMTSPQPLEVELRFQALNLNAEASPQNHDANIHLGNSDLSHFSSGADGNNYTANHPFAGYQCPSVIPSNDPYYGAYGGQTAGGQDMPGPSGLHEQAYYDWLYMNLMESSSDGERPGDNDPGNNLGDMGFFGDS